MGLGMPLYGTFAGIDNCAIPLLASLSENLVRSICCIKREICSNFNRGYSFPLPFPFYFNNVVCAAIPNHQYRRGINQSIEEKLQFYFKTIQEQKQGKGLHC